MVNKEKIIQEQRTIEAMKKGYMGLQGKFVAIAHTLGHVVYQQGGLNFEQRFLENYDDIPDENELPIMDEEEQSYPVGLAFDGLNRGMNLSILLKYNNREITVRYEGKLVYNEVAGDLEGFVPDEVWEEKIENLYGFCTKIEKQNRPIERKMLKEESDRKRKEILEKLKLKWGI